jgi:hypothetical protein
MRELHVSATPLPAVLRLFWAGSVAAFGLMFLIAWHWSRAGIPREGWDPLGDPFLGDLFTNMPTYRFVHTAAFWVDTPATPAVAYPPFGAILLGLLYATRVPALAYGAVAVAWLLLACWGVRRALIEQGISPWIATLFPPIVAATSFPIEGLLQRGNVELLLWIFAATGTWLFLRGYDDGAAILWALAAAAKLYPIIFFALLLSRRQYRAVVLGLASFLAVSVASMLYLGPDLRTAWVGSLRNVFGYQGVRVSDWNMHELAANHSFFTWVKTVAVVTGHPASRLTLPYYACGGVLFALLFFGRLVRLPIANQLLGVSVFMVLLPPVSYFYTLVHLAAPWLVLVLLALRAARAGVRVPGLSVTILLFLPVFACFSLFTFKSVLLFGGLIQGACLVILLLCSAVFPFDDGALTRKPEPALVELRKDALAAIQ